MKLNATANRRFRSRRGVTLVETAVYIALFLIVLNFAFAIFMGIVKQSADLRRASAQIAETMQAGELWRKDIRNAKGTLRNSVAGTTEATTAKGLLCAIPTDNGEIQYVIEGDTLWRQGADAKREPALRSVKQATLVRERREHAHGWRLEIELLSKTRGATPVTPLFTFIAADRPHP